MQKIPLIKDILLFEDEHIIVLNKPSGITSEGESGEQTISLASHIKKYFPKAMLCHRLDKDTSGVIIGAFHRDAYRSISMQLQNRQVLKKYHALLNHNRQYDEFTVHFPLSKKGSFKAVVDKKEGKEAITVLQTLEQFKGYQLVEAQPLTGRFHQIRVHLSSLGTPIMGDALYGGKPFLLSSVKRKYKLSGMEEEQPILARTALHAYSVQFEHPSGHNLTIEAPYPKDIRVSLELLRKHASLSI